MNVKYNKIIRLMLESKQMTAANMADKMNVSIRSIKTYISDINKDYPNVITSSRNGYTIDAKIAHQILNQEHSRIPQTSPERINYIVKKLIHHGNAENVLDIYDLCDELFISTSTLKSELNKVRRKLSEFDLQLASKGDFIRVTGLEKNKRKLLSSMLYDESNVNFINLKSLQNAFTDIDIERIRDIIIESFNKYHYFINDYSLINLVLHITIAIDRIRNNYVSNEDITNRPGICLHEYEMAQEIAVKIENEYHVKFHPAEVYEMTLLIISRATTIDYKSINESNIEEFIGKECFDLVKRLIEEVINVYFYINISEPEFLVRFALHIRNLLVRAENNYLSKNPLTEGIKTSCPLIYDVSVILANHLQQATGIPINDDEIAYIAFHIGSTLGEQKVLETKVSAVLYCPNYYDINLKLTDTIRQYFGDELLITNILTDESEIDKIRDADLIITTIPLSKVTSVPLTHVNLFFTDRDRLNLGDKLKNIQSSKQKSEFESLLRVLIKEEAFERIPKFMNQEHCIDYMVDKMVEQGYVDPIFKAEIMYRESVSSTAFGNFAIPHAMKMYAKKTGMYVVITDKSIEWGNHEVNLIIMMAFNRNERYLFTKTFEPITMILSEPENVKRITSCTTYEQFIMELVSLL